MRPGSVLHMYVHPAHIHTHTGAGGHSTYGQGLDFKIKATKGKMVFEALLLGTQVLWAGKTSMFSPGWWGPSPWQVSPQEMVQEIHQVLMDREDTCHRPCFSLHLDGNMLDHFSELRSVEGLQEGSVLRVVEGLSGSQAAPQGGDGT